MEKKELICIVCPNSCRVTVEESDGTLRVSGNQCDRGRVFAEAEFTHPVRMFTTTVRLTGAAQKRLPVITSSEIPKEKIAACQEASAQAVCAAPVSCGDVVLRDLCGLGVDLIATGSFEAVSA